MPSEFTYPEGVDDHEGIIAYADRALEVGQTYHLETERAALRNILFYLGHQWVTYDANFRLWRPLALKRSIPRPVTNRIAAIVNQGVSNLVSYRIPLSYSPTSLDADDVAAAGVADKVEQIIEKEAGARKLKKIAARWKILTGNTFLISNYDVQPQGGGKIPQLRCMQCGFVTGPKEVEENAGVCPQCEAENMWEPAVDPMGSPLMMDLPKGKFYTEIENVFTTYFDYEVPSIEESPYFMVARTRSKDWIVRVYGEEVAESLSYGIYEDPYSTYLETLAYASPTGGTVARGGNRATSDPRIKVRRIWIRPRADKAPEGIYAVVAGQKVLESSPWPYHTETGEVFLPVVHIPFDEVPGRILAKTRVDDLIPKQEQRNRIEAIIELHSQRMANATWLIPEGSGLTRVTGEQGQILRYNAMAGVPPPTRMSGDSPPPYLVQWLQQIDSEMDSVFGTLDVGRGEAPFKGASYALAALLDERQQQGQSNLQENWALGWMEWSRQNLNIWREYASDERTLSTGAGQWAIQKFSKAQLTGGVDIDVEVGQNQPRSSVARRAVVDQAVRLGLINPLDPMDKFQTLSIMGMPELMPDYKLDIESAARESDEFANGIVPDPPMPWDNHAIHLSTHTRLMKSEKFKGLSPEVQQKIQEHNLIHYMLMRGSAQSGGGSGTIAPKPGQGKGNTGGPNESGGGTDSEQMDAEAQGASPDTNTGASVEGMM